MELTAYVAGEPWTDRPQCACPTLTSMAISLNDRFPDEDRQLLAPLIPLLVGTRGTLEDRIARSVFMAWRTVSATLPMFLDVIKMTDLAEKLRATPQTRAGLIAARDTINAERGAIREAARKNAAAYAAYAAYAAADAADADARPIRLSAIETLRLACSIRAEKG